MPFGNYVLVYRTLLGECFFYDIKQSCFLDSIYFILGFSILLHFSRQYC